MRYPNKSEALYCVNDSVVKELGFEDKESLAASYDGYGSFKLPEFINFNLDIFKDMEKDEVLAKNEQRNNRACIGRAVLSMDTIAEGTSKGNSQYKDTIFDTGHLLGYMLIGKIKNFNSRKTNLSNVIPQTQWSNGRGFMKKDSTDGNGNCQRVYEQLVYRCIRKANNEKDLQFKVFYQVEAVYGDKNEEVPRGVIIQAHSTNSQYLEDFRVFIPNVIYNKIAEIDYSKIKLNLKKAKI